MARQPRNAKRPIESYDHRDKQRLNNPPVGLVTPATDRDAGRKSYAYDPHLDPQLQWAGKAEHTSFEVPTVSLHVHERIDPRTIIEATRKRNGNPASEQSSLFELPEQNPPVREAIEFYKHSHNWTNRLVAGDSLLVMNSLLEKEGMGGNVQMVYIDPPYGIRYGSNFQPFVNKRNVRDGNDEDLSQEPETIRAYRDTWELGIHSYLSYLRDRLLLARELLTESGSCFVQISDENVHLVRGLMDEVFGVDNFIALIPYRTKTMPFGTNFVEQMADFIIWYAKNKYDGQGRPLAKYRKLFREMSYGPSSGYHWCRMADGSDRRVVDVIKDFGEIPEGARIFTSKSLEPSGPMQAGMFNYMYRGVNYNHPRNGYGTTREGMDRLALAGRLLPAGKLVRYALFADDKGWADLTVPWEDTSGADGKVYAVQTNTKVITRCMLMTTDPGDLVVDPTCGSGTTAYVAERWGRRWITCDTSRVAISLAKQRLMTGMFDYYELAHPQEGVGSGFNYKTVSHVTLGSIANNPDIKEGMTQAEVDAVIARNSPQETLYDQPVVDRGKRRVTGPFSVEAVPAPAVRSLDDAVELGSADAVSGGQSNGDASQRQADNSVARSGETLRQGEWRDELLKTGIRGKAGQFVRFARLEPLPDYRHLHADGETLPNTDGADSVREGAARAAQRVVVSFGPEHAPLEQRQVNQALQEAETLRPSPRVIVFAAFQFDPEAAKDIDETNWPGITLLKAQMNPDLLTEDLKRKRASNESFWLIGQPDVEVRQIREGQNNGKWQVYVRGFDYYNTKSGDVESGGEDKIAMWMLDTDYDGRSLYPRQVFFPMSSSGPRANDGWARLARNLKAEIDEDLIEAYRGTLSLPFEPGDTRRVAVKVVDDRGIESLRVIRLDTALGGATSSRRKGRTLEETIVERGKMVPQEEWDRVPDDLSLNLDQYI